MSATELSSQAEATTTSPSLYTTSTALKVKFVLLRNVTLDHSHTNMDELLYLLSVIFSDTKIAGTI